MGEKSSALVLRDLDREGIVEVGGKLICITIHDTRFTKAQVNITSTFSVTRSPDVRYLCKLFSR